jgi:RimJ/RimL family protein N-acetyltransferase
MGSVEPRLCATRDGVKFRVQAVTEDDAATMLAYARRSIGSGAYDVTEPDEFTHTEDSERDWIKSIREADNCLLIAAWHGAQIMGALNFQGGKRRKMAHSGHFGISVLPDWRGRGVGSALLEVLIDWARQHPTLEEITLGVVEPNDGAARLYRRHGFVEIGRHPGKFRLGPGRYWADIHMSRWVKGGPG